MIQKTPDDWSYSESLVTFDLEQGYRMVHMYLEEEHIGDIHVHDFAKVIVEHDRLSSLEEDDISPISSDNVPQNDERIEFDDFEEFRSVSDDAFRHY